MPVDNKPSSTELDDLAFQLYSQRMAAQIGRRSGEPEAIESYRHAEAFVAVRQKVRSGALKVAEPEGPKLAPFRAPNLKRTHPHNLVSEVDGDLERVNRIKQWLDKNPTPERDPEDLLKRLNREFSVDWDLPAVNVARVIFPAYCK